MFNQQPTKKIPKEEEKCKIKFKKNVNSKEIQFSGKCSSEQVELAKRNLNEELD